MLCCYTGKGLAWKWSELLGPRVREGGWGGSENRTPVNHPKESIQQQVGCSQSVQIQLERTVQTSTVCVNCNTTCQYAISAVVNTRFCRVEKK